MADRDTRDPKSSLRDLMKAAFAEINSIDPDLARTLGTSARGDDKKFAEALEQCLTSPNIGLVAAGMTLARCIEGLPAEIQELCASYQNHPVQSIRDMALYFSGRMKMADEGTFQRLRTESFSGDRSDAVTAMLQLAGQDINKPGTLELLAAQCKSQDPEIRTAALLFIGLHAGDLAPEKRQKAAALGAECLQDTSMEVRIQAGNLLVLYARMSVPFQSHLFAALEREQNSEVSWKICYALAHVGPEADAPREDQTALIAGRLTSPCPLTAGWASLALLERVPAERLTDEQLVDILRTWDGAPSKLLKDKLADAIATRYVGELLERVFAYEVKKALAEVPNSQVQERFTKHMLDEESAAYDTLMRILDYRLSLPLP